MCKLADFDVQHGEYVTNEHFSLCWGDKYQAILQCTIARLYKWAMVMKGWKLRLSSPLRSFEHFLISIIPCAVFQHFDCALWNKQTHANTCTGYCHHLRIIEMCGWHVSSPSLLAGLIRAPLPGEHYTHAEQTSDGFDPHTHASCCTGSTTQPPQKTNGCILPFPFLWFFYHKTSQNKDPYLEGHTQFWGCDYSFSLLARVSWTIFGDNNE